MKKNTFDAVNLSIKITELQKEVLNKLRECDYRENADALNASIEKLEEADKIKITFAGQYSSGKSTIISALTGRTDIKIDSDVATSEVTNYDWGSVVLTDTPGLHSGNHSHDEIAQKAIEVADILVYCITSDLFNEYTLRDFNNLAFQLGYYSKIIFVVNKISKEATDNLDGLIECYRISLNKAMYPHSLREFPVCFIDAKDYREGIQSNDNDFIEYSRFETIIKVLNDFVSRKGSLCKLETPLQLIKNEIDSLLEDTITGKDNQAYLVILSRLLKKVNQTKNSAVAEWNFIVAEELSGIIRKGNELSLKIGSEDIHFSEKDFTVLVESVCLKIQKRLDEMLKEKLDNLNEEIENVMKSGSAEFYFDQINKEKISGSADFSARTKLNMKRLSKLNGILETATGGVVKLATGAKGSTGILNATGASGSAIHKGILAVGGKIGVKFKPWQAVNMAKNIGNVMKFVGPALAILTLVIDVKDCVDESAEARKIIGAQIEFREGFNDTVNQLEAEYSKERQKCVAVFEDITNQIESAQKEVYKENDKKEGLSKWLNKFNERLMDMKKEIHNCDYKII